MSERKICVVTGTRAEYGLLFWLMKEIAADPALILQLAVTGTHLEPKFGETVKNIEADGFTVDARVPIDLSDDSPTGVARSMGLALAGLAEAFGRLDPDIVVVLGDRYEILAAAEAAMLTRRIIAHIHGGEVTEGAMDDAMRHAITKLSHLHFAAAEPYRRRIVQMGEDPANVFAVGAPGLDNIQRLELPSPAEVFAGAGVDWPADAPYLLVTYHPETIGSDDPAGPVREMLAAFDGLAGYRVIFTGVNADPGRDAVAAAIDAWVAANPTRAVACASLGQVNYLAAMRNAAAVVGNSSSGIVEAPALGVPTVNIGERQTGRLRAESIVDCVPVRDAISDALEKALAPSFRAAFDPKRAPYGGAGASARIAQHLRDAPLAGRLRKTFHDIDAGVPA